MVEAEAKTKTEVKVEVETKIGVEGGVTKSMIKE